MESVSMPGGGSQPLLSSSAEPVGVDAHNVGVQAQQNVQVQPPTISVTKPKRKSKSTSIVWDHFEKIKDKTGFLIEGKCNYCGDIFQAQTKKHGTGALGKHMLACLSNPHSKDTRQSLLTFVPVSSGGSSEGVLGTWVFDQEYIRKALAEMVILDELPFRHVERQGFKRFVAAACPRFKIPSRWTVGRDVFKIYTEERLNLKKLFKLNTQRVSITTDTWTSIQRINYMCITAHFIDDQWKLQKRIISFVPISSHKGENIAKSIETCLIEWGVKNIFSVTVDNASSNDVAMVFLKKKLVSWGVSPVKCQYLHMRCIAHILNLVVQDGLSLVDDAVKRVRDTIRWVRLSPARLAKFRELADFMSVEAKSALCLDVPTRWNSTYLMLQTALAYRTVFEAYEENDRSMRADLGDSIPSYRNWCSVQKLVLLLKIFYDMTIRISGSLYVTSNTFLAEISDLSLFLADMMGAEIDSEKAMGTLMRQKFGKYWGDPTKMNFIIFYASILDPREKVEFLLPQFSQLYGDETGKVLFDKVNSSLTELFLDYSSESVQPNVVPNSVLPNVMPNSALPNAIPSSIQPIQNVSTPFGRPQSRLKSQLKKQRMESGSKKQSELEMYLSESTVDDKFDFDILKWWKNNSDRFPILSKMARDLLAVPISTVASESTFSTSGRILDSFRSSLTPKIVEALVCAQDWLRLPDQPILVEENLDEVEKWEKELLSGGSCESLGSSLPTLAE